MFKEITEEERIVSVITNLKQFGEWVKWEAVMQVDKRWHSLLACQSDAQMRFRLCAIEDVLPTDSLLQLWGQGDGFCPLCSHLGLMRKGSLQHILCGCEHCLKEKPQSRITWRHDSVLFAIFRSVLSVVSRFKKARAEGKLKGSTETAGAISFKSESNTVWAAPRVPELTELLAKAPDWKLMFDIDSPKHGQSKAPPFPAEILAGVSEIPDGLIWSVSSKTLIWVELTSPWEENMTTWHTTKRSKYNQLKIDCEDRGWKVHPLYVEVGCRGHVSQSFHYMCKVLGFMKGEVADLKYTVERTALLCSHAIFVFRHRREWEPRALLDVSEWN